MSGIHLKDLSKVYKEQIAEKKDDSYLETDMKKRQKNNDKNTTKANSPSQKLKQTSHAPHSKTNKDNNMKISENDPDINANSLEKDSSHEKQGKDKKKEAARKDITGPGGAEKKEQVNENDQEREALRKEMIEAARKKEQESDSEEDWVDHSDIEE